VVQVACTSFNALHTKAVLAGCVRARMQASKQHQAALWVGSGQALRRGTGQGVGHPAAKHPRIVKFLFRFGGILKAGTGSSRRAWETCALGRGGGTFVVSKLAPPFRGDPRLFASGWVLNPPLFGVAALLLGGGGLRGPAPRLESWAGHLPLHAVAGATMKPCAVLACACAVLLLLQSAAGTEVGAVQPSDTGAAA